MTVSQTIINDSVMKERQCTFEIHHVENEYVEKILLSLSDDRSPGTDNLDSKLLRITAKYISTPICHIFNKCLEYGVCPDIWKEAKVIPLPKDNRSAFTGLSLSIS